jgi:hypothetical protein
MCLQKHICFLLLLNTVSLYILSTAEAEWLALQLRIQECRVQITARRPESQYHRIIWQYTIVSKTNGVVK